MWSLIMILKAGNDARDTKQVTIINPLNDPVDFPLEASDFRYLLRSFPQVRQVCELSFSVSCISLV